MPPVRLYQLCRIIWGSYPCIICEEPEQPSAVAGVAALKKLVTEKNKVNPNTFLWGTHQAADVEKWEAQFATPEALEAHVVVKLADYKRADDHMDLLEHITNMNRVIEAHPRLAKYADLARLQKMIEDLEGPLQTPTHEEKVALMVQDGFAKESAEYWLEYFHGDMFAALVYDMPSDHRVRF